jgi:hypothetical protein
MITRWFTSLRIFLVWLLGFVLALVIFALGHELTMMFIVNTLKSGRYIVRLVFIVYFTIAGLLCVAYYIFIHDFLSTSAKKGRLLKNSLLTIGIQVLLICLIHLGLMAYGYFPRHGVSILVATLEGLVAAAMLFFALRMKKQNKIISDRK